MALVCLFSDDFGSISRALARAATGECALRTVNPMRLKSRGDPEWYGDRVRALCGNDGILIYYGHYKIGTIGQGCGK